MTKPTEYAHPDHISYIICARCEYKTTLQYYAFLIHSLIFINLPIFVHTLQLNKLTKKK